MPLVRASGVGVSGNQSQSQNPHISQKPRDVGHPRVPLSAGEFVDSYNATMTAKTGNLDVDRAAAGLRIHRHGELVRWVSVGMVK